jgi:GNAT superfamily N-acetyltransferase
MQEKHVRRATSNDANWIVDLSTRVQDALTAAGSLQQIGPLPLESVETTIRNGKAYVFEMAKRRLGSVLVDPIDTNFLYYAQWGLQTFLEPLWYLHVFMLDPEEQGKKLGLTFLDGLKRLVVPHSGTIVLDCWAGNEKLRDFYQRAGFTLHSSFPEKDYEVAVFFYLPPV